MKHVHFELTESGSPDSARWHHWRSGGIGGSDAATIAFQGGLLSSSDAASWQRDYPALVREKQGEKREFKESFAMRRGKELEPIIKQWHEKTTGILTSPIFGEMDEFPIIRSSFDGADLELDVLLEIKVANADVHRMAKEGRVVPYYFPQIVHQAITAWGRPEAWDLSREIHFVNHREGETVLAVISARNDALRRMAEGLIPLHLRFWDEVKCGRKIPVEVLNAAEAYRSSKLIIERETDVMNASRDLIIGYAKKSGEPKVEIDKVRATESARKGAVDMAEAVKALQAEVLAVLNESGIKDPSLIARVTLSEEKMESFRKEGTKSWAITLVA
ncbi:MAG: hypothetical protein DDT25_00031 [Chloroflexi bacterium]|nr:hypothetical protein [Chloroflexota bacterium]